MLFFIILLLCYAASYFMPWWVAAVIAFAAALWLGENAGRAFLAGFFGVAIGWVVTALLTAVPNDHILASRVAIMFSLPGWGWLLAVTAIIGGLVGGMAAMSGVLVRKLF